MPVPGNSEIALVAYWGGNPTNVLMAELNIPFGTFVVDYTTPALWQKTSTTDNSGFNLIATGSGTLTPSSIASTGKITSSSPTAGIGYATGAGGAVTQATNRTTGVTLNKDAGQITTNNASLAAETAATFTVTNSAVAIGDVPVLAIQSGSNGGNTTVIVSTVAAGSFNIQVANQNASGGTAETGAIIINYFLFKSVAA